MEELKMKPCPFCGRKVKIKKVKIPFDAGGSAKIAQCECGVFLNHTRWNSRPIEDTLTATIAQKAAEIERLREALKEIVDRNYTGASYIAKKALEANRD